MLIPIIINDQKAKVPSSWHDVTMKQFCQIVKTPQQDLYVFRLISILSDIPYSTLINIPADSFDSRVLDVLSFIHENPLNVHELDRPESLVIGKKTIAIPDPGKCTISQQLLLQAHCRTQEELNGAHCDLVLFAAAVYLQPLIDDSLFNEDRIDPVMRILESLPVIDLYPVGAFFLTGYITFLKLNEKPLNQPSPTMSEEPEPTNSSKTSMSST